MNSTGKERVRYPILTEVAASLLGATAGKQYTCAAHLSDFLHGEREVEAHDHVVRKEVDCHLQYSHVSAQTRASKHAKARAQGQQEACVAVLSRRQFASLSTAANRWRAAPDLVSKHRAV